MSMVDLEGQRARCDAPGCETSAFVPVATWKEALVSLGWSVTVTTQRLLCPAHAEPKPKAPHDVQLLIAEECNLLRDMLLEKNKAYGSSFSHPLRIFSKVDVGEMINVRLDDKLSRLARGSAAGEDVELDLMGYLVLKRVLRKMEKPRSHQKTRRCGRVGHRSVQGDTMIDAVDLIRALRVVALSNEERCRAVQVYQSPQYNDVMWFLEHIDEIAPELLRLGWVETVHFTEHPGEVVVSDGGGEVLSLVVTELGRKQINAAVMS